MQAKFRFLLKAFLLVSGGLLIGWVSYWAGFSKSLEIGLHINKRNWASQAAEYDRLVAQLDSGETKHVRANLVALSGMLKEEADVPAGEVDSIWDFLIPTGGLALVRDYRSDRERLTRAKGRH